MHRAFLKRFFFNRKEDSHISPPHSLLIHNLARPQRAPMTLGAAAAVGFLLGVLATYIIILAGGLLNNASI